MEASINSVMERVGSNSRVKKKWAKKPRLNDGLF